MNSHYSKNLGRLGISGASLGLALLATWQAGALPAREPLVLTRSGLEPRVATNGPRVAAKIGQPGQERRTHRGWEVYGEQLIVLANSSQADARLVAERFQAATTDSRRQLELLTGPLPRGNPARAAVQIMVDHDAWKGPPAQPPLIRRSGYAESVYLNVGPGQPPLQEQLDRLNQAAAVRVVDTYLSGPAVPEPLRVGLASFLAPQSDILFANEPQRSTTGARLVNSDQVGNAGQVYQQLRADSVARGRHPWKPAEPSQPGLIASPEEDQEGEIAAAKKLVEFLLTGYDGRYAAAFGQAVRAAVLQQEAELQPRRLRPSEVAATSHDASPLAQFLESLQPQFEAWQQDPLVGLPRWEPLDKDDPQLAERQRELFFVLRLLQRSATSPLRQVEPKVIEVTANGGTSRELKPSTGRPIDLARWVQAASQSNNRWAIVDSNGLLLWSHDTDQLRQRLALEAGRYSAAWREGRIVVREALGGGRTLEASLTPDAAAAQFAVITED